MSVTDGESLPGSVGKERKRSPRVVILAVVLAAVLIVGAVAWLTVQSGNKKSEYTMHSPSYIKGNANFTAANGVIGGSGNASDPYIIANWDIDASNSVGIYIENTDAHFIIRNCYVHGGSTRPGGMQVGIILDNCSNGTLSSNECSSNLNGVVLYGLGNNNTVVNNTCNSNDQNGIVLYLSNNNTLISNKCLSNGRWGIILDASSNNTLSENTCSSNGEDGIWLDGFSSNNEISWNPVSKNSGYGIDISSGSNNRIWYNIIIGNNGATGTYEVSHAQASDNGTNNRWNSSDAYGNHGNYWSDWTTHYDSYIILGSAGAKDQYPLHSDPRYILPSFIAS